MAAISAMRAVGGRAQHFSLALGEGSRVSLELRRHEGGIEKALTSGHAPNGVGELVGGRVLAQEAGHAGAHRAGGVPGLAEPGEDERADVGQLVG